MSISKEDAEATKRFFLLNGLIGFASEIGAIQLIKGDEAEKWVKNMATDLQHWRHVDEEK